MPDKINRTDWLTDACIQRKSDNCPMGYFDDLTHTADDNICAACIAWRRGW